MIFIREKTIMIKVLFGISLLFITMSALAQEQGMYDINTEDFILTPNYETGLLKITTRPFTDTLDVSIWKDGAKVDKYSQHVKTNLITLNFHDVKTESYILLIYSGTKKIFRKHILIKNQC